MRARMLAFGAIEIDGERFDSDVVIERGHVRRRRKKPSKRYRDRFGHTPLSAEESIPWAGSRLIVGAGVEGRLPVMDELHELARGPLGPLSPDAAILAVMPQPTDLTPADTSSTVRPGLGRALRTRFAAVEEVVTGMAPTDSEIAGVRARARAAGVDAVVVGTIDAIRQPGQTELVRALAGGAPRMVGVALRTPWDVALYPDGMPAICTYSILPDSLEALAAALAGAIPFAGRLPVAVPGFAP